MFLKWQTTFSRFLKVRRRSPRELGDWHVGLAVTVGDCDWLLLLYLWGGAAEFDRSSSSPAGHRQGQHRARPSGQRLYSFTFIMFPSSLRIFHTWCNKQTFYLIFWVVLIRFCVAPADLWPWKGQRRTHVVPPADGLYLREWHPHRFPRCSGSHPLHVSTEINSHLLPFSKNQQREISESPATH